MRKTYWRSIQKSIYRSWLSLLVFFPKVTLSNYFPRKKDVRLPNGKNQIGNKLCSKTTSEKVTETHFQKVLKRQKSANSTIQKVLIRQKDAQTTLFLKFYSKSFSNLLGIEWHLLSLERTKIINASLYIMNQTLINVTAYSPFLACLLIINTLMIYFHHTCYLYEIVKIAFIGHCVFISLMKHGFKYFFHIREKR